MCLQQGGVNEIVSVNDALSQSACHLAVVCRIYYLLRVILTLLPAVAAEVVNEAHLWELPVNLIVYTVGYGAAWLTQDDVLLAHAAVVDHGAHQCQRNERRGVELYGVVVCYGIVDVELHGNLLALLIAATAPAMRLVEMTEECLPGLLGRRLARQLHHSFRYHGIGLRLIVPTVFYPETRLAVPLGDTGTMHPGNTPRMDTLANTNRFVGADKEFGILRIKLAKEHPLAVHWF